MASLLLVGCGKMGSALLEGWLAQGVDADEVVVVEPSPAAVAPQGVRLLPTHEKVPSGFAPEVVVLAVKPQVMPLVVPLYREFATPANVFLSIAAGRPIRFIEEALGQPAGVVRAMPNTPASIGRGMTVLCANGRVRPEQRERCELLLRAVGGVAWVENEELMDAVTAVSGSGPAYVFFLVESLAAVGVAAGLPAELALRLARETVAGAGELLRRSSLPPETLRRNVTSPGGTTAAALEVLGGPEGWAGPIERAVAAATRRSRELAG